MVEPRPSLIDTTLHLPARAADGLLWIYQRTVSPALAAAFPTCGCRFHPTCSQFARQSLRDHGLLKGTGLAALRLARCGPWHPGGLDPVPPRNKPVCRPAPSSLLSRSTTLS